MKQWLRRRIRRLLEARTNHASILNYAPYRPDLAALRIDKAPDHPTDLHRGLPIPPPELFAGYGSTAETYISLAETHVRTMRRLLAETGFTPTRGDRILDHGCAAGRMIRCLRDLADECEIWGTDITASFIYWCQQHLSPPFHFAVTTTVPHLPFEDRTFRLIYCGSVFTHIDDLTMAWLLELRRILVPGGRAYLTIHDGHTLDLLAGQHADTPLARQLRASGVYRPGDKDFNMLVVNRRGQWSLQTFYDLDYFCSLVKPMYRVLSCVPEAYGYQTAVIVERR
jgi:ubiquinone/menaquinone biosynthesis C-methylase UbiE